MNCRNYCINKRINFLRYELASILERKGIVDSEVINVSRVLDGEIVNYYRITNNN